MRKCFWSHTHSDDGTRISVTVRTTSTFGSGHGRNAILWANSQSCVNIFWFKACLSLRKYSTLLYFSLFHYYTCCTTFIYVYTGKSWRPTSFGPSLSLLATLELMTFVARPDWPFKLEVAPSDWPFEPDVTCHGQSDWLARPLALIGQLRPVGLESGTEWVVDLNGRLKPAATLWSCYLK